RRRRAPSRRSRRSSPVRASRTRTGSPPPIRSVRCRSPRSRSRPAATAAPADPAAARGPRRCRIVHGPTVRAGSGGSGGGATPCPESCTVPGSAPHAEEAVSASPAVEQSSGTPAQPEAAQTFADFDVRRDIVEALAAKGITTPFPIQSLTLPVALRGRDIIGQAKTGTGKTLGFGIPLLQSSVAPGEPNPQDRPIGKPQALVVLPTRELAVQVAKDLETASAKRPIRILTVYGGRAYEPQIEALEKGVEVVVGTPGRLIDLMRQKHLDLSQARTAVLDEADEMLDLGFLEDIEKLLQAVPENRQTMLFSATMPGPSMALARRFMKQPTHIRAHDPGDEARTKADIAQVVYRAHQLDKIEVMARILQARGRGLSIIFMRTKRQADRVAGDLADRGFAAAPLHGDLGQ